MAAPRALTLAALACSALASPQPAFAQTASGGAPDYTDVRELPAGPRGERIRGLVEAVSSGDAGRLEAFLAGALAPSFLEQIPLEEHVRLNLGFYDASHGFELHGVRRYTPPRAATNEVVIVRNRLSGAWQAFTVAFEEGPAARITGIEFSPARPPRDLPPLPSLTRAEAVAELGALVDRLAAAEAFSGSVLWAEQGRPLYSAARGLADRNHAVPNRLETKFNLGSMNKMFTALLVAQLVERGELRFEDTLERWLGGKGWTRADLS